MKPQRFEIINQRIRDAFLEKKALYPDQMRKRLKFSWSNWGFGLEDFAVSCARLEKAGIRFIELHGNHYGADLGYHPEEIRTILADHGITCAGVCGMFSADNDLSSNRHIQRQAAIDYIKREVAFTAEMGGKYMLVCPAAVGRSKKYDDSEIERSIDSLSRVAHLFTDYGVRAAIEPIRAAETSIVHTFAEARVCRPTWKRKKIGRPWKTALQCLVLMAAASG